MSIEILLLIIIIFLSVCFLTLLERKILGYVQNRKGPVKVVWLGLLQPLLDGGKLITKRVYIENWLYFIIPFLSLVLIRLLRVGVWLIRVSFIIRNMVFFVLVIRSVIVYVIFLLGWVRENVYGVLGGMRSSSQIVGYEIIIFFVFLLVVLYYGRWNFLNYSFSFLYLLDLWVIWLIILLVETNRSPYDFAEGERELVSGFNVEYAGVLFAFIFIAEYGIIIVISWVTRIIFGYWWIFWLVLLFVILVRGFVPRRRYDLLISNCWKFFSMVLRFLIFKFF